MPSGKSNTSGSENGSVVYQPRSALPDHRRVQALLDRRPDRERRREVVAVDDEIGAVAHADLVDLGEQLVGGVAGEHVREARLDADPDQGEPPGLLPALGLRELRVAELHAASSASCGRERHRHVEVGAARASNAASKIGGLKRGSTALRIASTRSARASSAIAAASDASTAAPAEARIARSLGGGLRARRVDVREHEALEAVASLGHCCGCAPTPPAPITRTRIRRNLPCDRFRRWPV